MDIEKNFKTFIRYLTAYIKRDGVEKLLEWLIKSTDIAVAPASARYHNSFEGGLIQHSLNVFNRLISLVNLNYGSVDKSPYSKETIALVALLHDISKVNFYEISFRNVKNQETGQWEKVPYYSIRPDGRKLIYATHEENSVHIIRHFIDLTDDECLAIRWHSSYMSSTDKDEVGRMMSAFKLCNLALLLHIADMMATCIDEEEPTDRVDWFYVEPESDIQESDTNKNVDSSEVTTCNVDGDNNGTQQYSKRTAEKNNDCPF